MIVVALQDYTEDSRNALLEQFAAVNGVLGTYKDILVSIWSNVFYAMSIVVEALCYKLDGRGFENR
jgi:hypothetical protein